MPTIAPITQPHEIRPTAAAIASAMTTRIAIGVAIVSAKSTRELAPVSKGEVLSDRGCRDQRGRSYVQARDATARHGEKEGIVASITPCVVVRVIRPRLPTRQEGRFPGKCPGYLSQCDECAESAEMRDVVSAYHSMIDGP